MSRVEAFFELTHKAKLFDLSLGADTVYIKDGHEQIKAEPARDHCIWKGLKDYTRIVTATHPIHGALIYREPVAKQTVRIVFAYSSELRRAAALHRPDWRATGAGCKQFTLPVGRSYKSVLNGIE